MSKEARSACMLIGEPHGASPAVASRSLFSELVQKEHIRIEQDVVRPQDKQGTPELITVHV
jgi:hypothetical protein